MPFICPQHGRTALHRAAARGYEPIVNELLRFGANFDMADNDGETALMKAARYGRVEVRYGQLWSSRRDTGSESSTSWRRAVMSLGNVESIFATFVCLLVYVYVFWCVCRKREGVLLLALCCHLLAA